MRIMLAVILILAAPSVGCESTDGEMISRTEPGPSITIDEPTEETSFRTGCDTVWLAGTARVNIDWYRCCPPGDDSTVTWTNDATQQDGVADEQIVQALVVAWRDWSAPVPLAEGANRVVVTQTWVDGPQRSDTITVHRDPTLPCD